MFFLIYTLKKQEIMKLSVYNVLNSEGNILSIHFQQQNILVYVLLEDGSGKIKFETSRYALLHYLSSNITLIELLKQSKDEKIEFQNYSSGAIYYIKKSKIGALQCGNQYYNQQSLSMKMPIEDRIDLLIKIINHGEVS